MCIIKLVLGMQVQQVITYEILVYVWEEGGKVTKFELLTFNFDNYYPTTWPENVKL